MLYCKYIINFIFMAELKGLCMRCRDAKSKPQMREMKDVRVEEKNARYSAKGVCTVCGGNMFKFLSKEDAEKFKK